LANRPNDFTNGTPIDTIALMSKVEKTAAANVLHARAKFWRHYCAQKIGDEKNQAEAQQSLFEENPLSFQALATTAEKDSLAEKAKSQETPQVAFRSLVRPELNAILRASEALMRLKENQFAIEILDKNLREIGSIEPEVRVYVAINLNRLEATLPKFKLLAELFQEAPKTLSVATLQLYFPLSYFDLIKKKENKIDPFLILSLIRQESAFNKDARSIAGARGLMQVMPQTARMVARVRAQNLFNPDVNIAVGAKYFMNRLKQYDGDVELTLAAYNAGFMRVDDWKKRYPTDNRILFLDFIPFRETREYVTSILRNYYWYVNLYEDENSGNKNRMPASRAAKSETVLTGKKTDISKKNHAIVSGNAGIAAGSIESVTDDAPAVSDGASGSGAAPMEAKDVSTDNLRDKPIKQ
jgi:soluble lytic murein transglycosylase